MNWKKWFFIILAILILGLPHPSRAAFSIDAKAAILLEPYSGRILYDQDSHKHLAPASVTKIMTMLLIMEAVESGRVKWTDKIPATRSAADMGGSQVYLKEGEVFSLHELFETIAVVSANDSSTAVAEYLYGSIEDFVNAMNDKAAVLGLKDTHFANETGLPNPDHYSSAYDLAMIARELIVKHPKIFEFTSVWLDTFRGGKFQLRNTNELLKQYSGADGLKTGYTDEAKYCLAGTAKRNNFRLLSVVMGTPSDAQRVAQTKRILDYGYRTFQLHTVQSKTADIGKIHIPNAQPLTVPVKLKQDFAVVVERGKTASIKTVLKPASKLKLPLPAGSQAGTLQAMSNGQMIGEVPVYTTVEVHRANFIVRAWRWFVDWLHSLFGGKKKG